MDVSFFVRGLLIGFSIAAVVGPIGMLCISRTMQKGFLYGLITGLGGATADAIYGSIAAFGLTLISTLLINQQFWIRLVGGMFLIYLGLRTLLTPPAEKAALAKGQNFLVAYTSTLLLTLINPLTILSFAAIFASLGVGIAAHNNLVAALVVLGVFCGSSTWWLFLSGSVSLLRSRLTRRWLIWVNIGAGTAITIFGIIAIISLIW